MSSKLLLGSLGGVVAVAVVVAVVAASGGGAASRAAEIAVALPSNLSAFVAMLEPRLVLGEVDKRVPEAERKQLSDELGFDPLSVAGWRGAGVDLSYPVAFGSADLDDGAAVIAVRAAGQPDDLKRFVEALAKLRLIRRLEPAKFGDVDGYTVHQRVAFVGLNGYLYVVAGPREEGLTLAVQRLKALTPETSLARTDAFAAGMDGLGAPQLVAFFDTAAFVGGLRGRDDEVAAARAALSLTRTVSGGITIEPGEVHTRVRVVTAVGSVLGELLRDQSRDSAAFERLPAPVLAGLHAQVSPDALRTAFTAGLGLERHARRDYDKSRDQVRELTGVDIDTDLLGATTGEVGVLLGRLPYGGNVAGLELHAFVGVKDAERFTKTVDSILRGLEGMRALHVERTDIDGGTLFTIQVGREDLSVGVAVHDGRAWFSFNVATLQRVLAGDAKPYGDDAHSAEVAAVIGGSAPVAAFVDVAELLRQAGPLMGRRAVPAFFTGAAGSSLTARADSDVVTIDERFTYEAAVAAQQLDALAGTIPWDRVHKALSATATTGLDAAVQLAEDAADTVCGCRDAACAQRAIETYGAEVVRLMGDLGSDDLAPRDLERLNAATQRWMKCQTALDP